MSNVIVQMCSEFKEGFGYCEKKLDHEGSHVFPPFSIKCNNCGAFTPWMKAWREAGTGALVCGQKCHDEIQKKFASEIVSIS
jgi:hypothetical protein